MRLTDLKPQFIRYSERQEMGKFRRDDGTDEERMYMAKYIVPVETLAEAQGVMFLCPICFQKNGGPQGTHRVMCWSRSRGTPEHAEPMPGRWTLDGTSLQDLTLNGDQPGDNPRAGARSVLLIGGCGWHGHITNGEVT